MRLARLFTPEGFIMISIGFVLDFFNLLAVAFYAAFGIGAILEKINYFFGLVIVSLWQFGKLSGIIKIDSKSAPKARGKKFIEKFFKGRIKWLLFKLLPVIGNLRFWTYDIIKTFDAAEEMEEEQKMDQAQEEMMAREQEFTNQSSQEQPYFGQTLIVPMSSARKGPKPGAQETYQDKYAKAA